MRDHVDEAGRIDYGAALPLDAEALAEGGIAQAYARVAPHLRELGITPAPMTEHDDGDGYAIECAGRRYAVWPEPDEPDAPESWALATFALFDVVNRQLEPVAHRFYAINGGNDLIGIVLLPASALRARQVLANPSAWPYLPTTEPDWGGMFHRDSSGTIVPPP